jgi:hypothetical protein
MTREEELQAIAKWKKENDGVVGDFGDQRFCCVPYSCEQKLIDCQKRRADHKTHYYDVISIDGVKRKKESPKAKFVFCYNCNVWKNMPEQKVMKNGGQSGKRGCNDYLFGDKAREDAVRANAVRPLRVKSYKVLTSEVE